MNPIENTPVRTRAERCTQLSPQKKEFNEEGVEEEEDVILIHIIVSHIMHSHFTKPKRKTEKYQTKACFLEAAIVC